MAAAKKVFSEQTKSKIEELYGDNIENVISKNAVLDVYGVPITFRKITDEIIKNQTFLSMVEKSSLVDFDSIDFAKIQKNMSDIAAIPKSKETAVIEIVKVCDFPKVKFMHSEMIKGKFVMPRIVIDLKGECIEAYRGVRINTGYVVKINTVAMGKTISDGKIVNTRVGSQPDFIVVPQIVSKHDGLIPCVYGRDPEDTGFLTINFTTTKKLDTSKPLQIVLNAYTIERSFKITSILNSETKTELFKAKDNRSGRWIKNPKTKFLANKFDLDTTSGAVLLDTFDHSKLPVVMYEKQKIKIEKAIALFTSRKREWCDSHLVTVAGIYNPINGKHSEGIIVEGSQIKHNPHCMVFIRNKITVFSVAGTYNRDCRLLNGAFSDSPAYTDVNRDIRKVNSSLIDLMYGAKIAQDIASTNPKLNVKDLLKLFDYNRSLTANDPKLQSKIESSDEKLFGERPADLNCYSVNLYKGLKSLAYQCCSSFFTEEQLKELSLSCAKVKKSEESTGIKRKMEDSPAVGTSKRVK